MSEGENVAEEEIDIDIVHLMTPYGCKISFNGQGHFPCDEHKGDPS